MAYKLDYQFDRSNVITIDPGVHTACCLWQKGVFVKSLCFTGAMRNIVESIMITIDDYPLLNCAIIEGVDFRVHNEVSVAAAAKGDLSKLAYTVGALQFVCMQRLPYVNTIRFIDWAGQLSYSQLRIIERKKFNFVAPNEHIAAAYGIGLWAKGLL